MKVNLVEITNMILQGNADEQKEYIQLLRQSLGNRKSQTINEEFSQPRKVRFKEVVGFGDEMLLIDNSIGLEIPSQKSKDGKAHIVEQSLGLGERRDSRIPLDETVEEVIAAYRSSLIPKTNEFVIRFSNALEKMLLEKNAPALIDAPLPKKEDILSRLQALDILIESNQENESFIKEKYIPATMLRKVGPFLAVVSVLAGLQIGSAIPLDHVPSFANANTVNQTTEGSSSEGENKYHRPSFLESLPQDIDDWQVNEINNSSDPFKDKVSAAGDYILNTSHNFEDGKWHYENEIKEQFVPSDFHKATDNYLLLKRTYGLNPFGQAEFKLPIQNLSKVAEIEIKGSDGSFVPFKAFTYKDNTVGVVIDLGFNSHITSVSVREYLIQSNKDIVKATKPLAPVDLKKVSKKARDRYNKVLQDNNDAFFPYFLSDDMKESDKYSLDPKGKEKVNNAKTAVEEIDAVYDLSSVDCDPANTGVVLLSSAYPDKALYLNMAYGYSIEENSQKAGYLNQLNLHGFAISNIGSTVDATPEKLDTSSPLTKEYDDLKARELYLDVLTHNKKWLGTQEIIAEDAKTAEQISYGLEWGAGGIPLALAGAFLADSLSKTSERRRKRKERTYAQSYDFLTGLCWSDGKSNSPRIEKISRRSKGMRLEELRQNLHKQKLEQYLEKVRNLPHPLAFEDYEKKVGVSYPQALLFRRIAHELLYKQ